MQTVTKKLLFWIKFKLEFALGIKNQVRAQRNPLSKEDDRRHTVTRLVKASNVDVAIDIGLNVRVRCLILAREIQQVTGRTLRDGLLLLRITTGAVLVGPTRGNRICPAGMYGRIQPLAYLIIKAPAREAIHGRLDSNVVAMGNEQPTALCLDHRVAIEDSQSQLVAQVVKEPHVVVSCHPGDAHASIRQLGQLAKKADIATRNNILVLIPVIQDITHEEKLARIMLDAVKESAHTPLPLQGIGHVLCPQMQVRDEI